MINFKKKTIFAWFFTAIIVFLFSFLCNADAGIKGNIKINLELKEPVKDPDTIVYFGELPNKNYVPAGSELAAIASFETTVITVKCSYDFILECAEKICEEKKYSGFGLINLKRPNLINSCYQSDIVFFIALE